MNYLHPITANAGRRFLKSPFEKGGFIKGLIKFPPAPLCKGGSFKEFPDVHALAF